MLLYHVQVWVCAERLLHVAASVDMAIVYNYNMQYMHSCSQ